MSTIYLDGGSYTGMLQNLRMIRRVLTLPEYSLCGFCESRSTDGATAASSASDSNQGCLPPDVFGCIVHNPACANLFK